MKITLYHVESGTEAQITEQKVKMICADMILNDEMDTIGDDPIAKPEDDLAHIVDWINNCSKSVVLKVENWEETSPLMDS